MKFWTDWRWSERVIVAVVAPPLLAVACYFLFQLIRQSYFNPRSVVTAFSIFGACWVLYHAARIVLNYIDRLEDRIKGGKREDQQ